MTVVRKGRWILAGSVAVLLVGPLAGLNRPSFAGVKGAPAALPERLEVPSGTATATLERRVTVNQMMVEERAGTAPTAVPDHDLGALPQPGVKSAPTRAQRAERQAAARQSANAVGGAANGTPEASAPPNTLGVQFNGVSRQVAGGCAPPDSDGAVGRSHYVEIVNCVVRMYTKAGAVLSTTSLRTFFNDGDSLFDPRAVYDQSWDRFVMLVTRRADSGTDPNRYYKLAVSRTGNPTGAWFIYRVNFSGSNGEWCDYPQLGLGQDEILVTCNTFDDTPPGDGFRTLVMAIPKARTYNGWGFSFPTFSPADTFAIAPPVLVGGPQQQNDSLFFLMADDANNQVDLFRMNDGAHPASTTFVKQANINVPAWSQPFDAFNCGGAAGVPNAVDALEGRFQQNSWQTESGTSVWNIHSEGIGGWITPVYFQVNYANNTITRRGVIDTANTDEWNASLAVNSLNEVSAIWNRTANNTTTCHQVMRGGCQVAAGDCDANIGPGIININSAGPVLNIDSRGRNRWGDYSSIEPDPVAKNTACGAQRQAWGVIERVGATDRNWDDRIVEFGFC